MSQMNHILLNCAIFAVLFTLISPNTRAADSGPLRAGAAKIDITPDANAIPKPLTSILDHLYARAVFLDNGHSRAVLISVDLGGTNDETWEKLAK